MRKIIFLLLCLSFFSCKNNDEYLSNAQKLYQKIEIRVKLDNMNIDYFLMKWSNAMDRYDNKYDIQKEVLDDILVQSNIESAKKRKSSNDISEELCLLKDEPSNLEGVYDALVELVTLSNSLSDLNCTISDTYYNYSEKASSLNFEIQRKMNEFKVKYPEVIEYKPQTE